MTRDGLEYGPGTVTNPRIRDLECRFHFEDPGWNPEVGLWSIERARMERAFRHALDAYEARMRGRARRRLRWIAAVLFPLAAVREGEV